MGIVLEIVFEFALYWTGKPIVRALSFGRLHVALIKEPDENGKREGRAQPLVFTSGGKRYVDPEAVALVGLVFWVAVIVVLWLVRRGP